MRTVSFASVVTLAAFAGTPAAVARPARLPDYEALLREADLVVVAKPTGSQPAADKYDSNFDFEFVGVDTTFEVLLTFKGDAPKGKLTVLHYKRGRLKPGRTELDAAKDPPFFVTFHTKPTVVLVKGTGVDVPAPDYLLFLKRRADGRYEPASGQIDADGSIREMFRAGPLGLSDPLRYARDNRPPR